MLCDFHLLDLLSKGGTISDRTEVNRLELSQLVCWNEAVLWIALVAYLVPYLPVTPTSESFRQYSSIHPMTGLIIRTLCALRHLVGDMSR